MSILKTLGLTTVLKAVVHGDKSTHRKPTLTVVAATGSFVPDVDNRVCIKSAKSAAAFRIG